MMWQILNKKSVALSLSGYIVKGKKQSAKEYAILHVRKKAQENRHVLAHLWKENTRSIN